MRIIATCAQCLFDKQRYLSKDENYLKEIKEIIENRKESDTAPYLVYLFGKVYEKHFGKRASYADIKKKYNNLVLSMEKDIRKLVEESDHPLEAALLYARVGNYIDFGAMNMVDDKTFLSLFFDIKVHDRERNAIDSFFRQVAEADKFLLITDNCGEIVLDKIFVDQLKKSYPDLKISVLVRGEEVLNDATMEDAEYVGIDKYAEIITNGSSVAGTIYEMLPDKARIAMDTADVILAKGQGNYESLCGQGRHIFYSFLCKCDLFTNRFSVPKLTGMFVEEN
ncbi:MAG: ARMT1-like domain-containing protein [Eubacterium sp.]|nr:ARMT1-like domain-containing protein [Eubacterium sp.]